MKKRTEEVVEIQELNEEIGLSKVKAISGREFT